MIWKEVNRRDGILKWLNKQKRNTVYTDIQIKEGIRASNWGIVNTSLQMMEREQYVSKGIKDGKLILWGITTTGRNFIENEGGYRNEKVKSLIGDIKTWVALIVSGAGLIVGILTYKHVTTIKQPLITQPLDSLTHK